MKILNDAYDVEGIIINLHAAKQIVYPIVEEPGKDNLLDNRDSNLSESRIPAEIRNAEGGYSPESLEEYLVLKYYTPCDEEAQGQKFVGISDIISKLESAPEAEDDSISRARVSKALKKFGFIRARIRKDNNPVWGYYLLEDEGDKNVVTQRIPFHIESDPSLLGALACLHDEIIEINESPSIEDLRAFIKNQGVFTHPQIENGILRAATNIIRHLSIYSCPCGFESDHRSGGMFSQLQTSIVELQALLSVYCCSDLLKKPANN